jgi:hypothetical protein
MLVGLWHQRLCDAVITHLTIAEGLDPSLEERAAAPAVFQ